MSSESVDVSDTIVAKSDQLNADDLVSGEITVRITGVNRCEKDQPIAISITGGHMPFKPCKTVRRILVAAWGANAANWIGQSMVLYRDHNVKWGGENVGGIRVRAMTGIKTPLVLALAESRKSKAKITIHPLKDAVVEWRQKMSDCTTVDELKHIGQQLGKAGLADADLKVLRDYYGVRNRELMTTPHPDATDLNAANDPVLAMRHTISNIRDDNDRANCLESIRDLFESGSIDQVTCDELVAEANKKR